MHATHHIMFVASGDDQKPGFENKHISVVMEKLGGLDTVTAEDLNEEEYIEDLNDLVEVRGRTLP